jgi:hypothetical protein
VTRNCASAILFFRSTSSVGKTLEQKSSNPVSGRRMDNLGKPNVEPRGFEPRVALYLLPYPASV